MINDHMEKPPVGRSKPLITNIMWRNLISQALYQVVMLLTLQFKGEAIFGVNEKVKDTLLFNTFVFCQVFNEFNSRKLEKKNVFEGILRNKLFMGIIGVTVVLQVVKVEFLKKFAVIFKAYDIGGHGKVTFNDIIEVLRDLTGSFMSEKQREQILSHVLEEAGYPTASSLLLDDFIKILGNSGVKMDVEIPVD
ncbi:hypothetical protein GIB67_014858 [Kingdonia uniflora]|uniref:EF-hand domain-containing protein n=1 Tax=Kingdonia uniflora TaxID=39325 RepID=A0A7J7MT98_9MAGN|nr:hypothetical protein GIB67_014858 [Kingdonia uniflora]